MKHIKVIHNNGIIDVLKSCLENKIYIPYKKECDLEFNKAVQNNELLQNDFNQTYFISKKLGGKLTLINNSFFIFEPSISFIWSQKTNVFKFNNFPIIK